MNVPIHPINYPIDAFPKTLRDAILEVQRNLQAPLPLIAMSFLSAMSATAQAQVKVKHPISGQIKPATLYLFAVADSGERKSTVDLKICAPLKTFDEISQAQYSEAPLEDPAPGSRPASRLS